MDVLRQLVARLEAVVRSNHAVNVNSAEAKKIILDGTQEYFEAVRPQLLAQGATASDVGDFDKEWRRLAGLAHSNNAKTSYKTVLKSIAKTSKKISVELLGAIPTSSAATQQQSAAESEILKTLDALVPTAAQSYRQAIADLEGPKRSSYRGTATELRECLREILDHLAPDEEVSKAPGFKLEKDRPRPTMKQKARHILKARGSSKTSSGTAEASIEAVEEMLGALARSIYERASLSTHTTTSESEVRRIKRYVETLLHELLELDGAIR